MKFFNNVLSYFLNAFLVIKYVNFSTTKYFCLQYYLPNCYVLHVCQIFEKIGLKTILKQLRIITFIGKQNVTIRPISHILWVIF